MREMTDDVEHWNNRQKCCTGKEMNYMDSMQM